MSRFYEKSTFITFVCFLFCVFFNLKPATKWETAAINVIKTLSKSPYVKIDTTQIKPSQIAGINSAFVKIDLLTRPIGVSKGLVLDENDIIELRINVLLDLLNKKNPSEKDARVAVWNCFNHLKKFKYPSTSSDNLKSNIDIMWNTEVYPQNRIFFDDYLAALASYRKITNPELFTGAPQDFIQATQNKLRILHEVAFQKQSKEFKLAKLRLASNILTGLEISAATIVWSMVSLLCIGTMLFGEHIFHQMLLDEGGHGELADLPKIPRASLLITPALFAIPAASLPIIFRNVRSWIIESIESSGKKAIKQKDTFLVLVQQNILDALVKITPDSQNLKEQIAATDTYFSDCLKNTALSAKITPLQDKIKTEISSNKYDLALKEIIQQISLQNLFKKAENLLFKNAMAGYFLNKDIGTDLIDFKNIIEIKSTKYKYGKSVKITKIPKIKHGMTFDDFVNNPETQGLSYDQRYLLRFKNTSSWWHWTKAAEMRWDPYFVHNFLKCLQLKNVADKQEEFKSLKSNILNHMDFEFLQSKHKKMVYKFVKTSLSN